MYIEKKRTDLPSLGPGEVVFATTGRTLSTPVSAEALTSSEKGISKCL